MHSVVQTMLEKYTLVTTDDHRNALKEIIQEIALLGLYRAGFFTHAAFYGGTSLRIFYGLDRFSEDLDFSLLQPDTSFSLRPYCKAVQDELAAFGFVSTVTAKEKQTLSQIESAFIKTNTLTTVLQIQSITPAPFDISPNEVLKIKLEVDTDPPPYAEYEIKYTLLPIPFAVRVFSQPCLFAGKLHALLCRNWKNRVKGRDLYDFVWYLSHNIPVHLQHLQARMQQTGHFPADETLDKTTLHRMLEEYFSRIDHTQAKQDIRPFINDPIAIEVWNADFFNSITRDKLKSI